MKTRNLEAERLDAQLREAAAQLDVLQAQAEARKAKDEMDEISGLRAAQERARKDLAGLKRQTAGSAAAARRKVEGAVHDLEAGIERARERYAETTVGKWDEARERRFYARLDEADARLRVWKAQADQKLAGQAIKVHDDLATLEERIALARARSTEAAHHRHNRQAQEALEEAARRFDEAYDAAAKRYEG